MGERLFNPFNYDDPLAQNPFNFNQQQQQQAPNNNYGSQNKDLIPSFNPNLPSSNFGQTFQPQSSPLAQPQGRASRGSFSSDVPSSYLLNTPNSPPLNNMSDSFLAGPQANYPIQQTQQGFTQPPQGNFNPTSQPSFRDPISTQQNFIPQGNFPSFPNQQNYSPPQSYVPPISNQYSSPPATMAGNYQGINPHILREIQNELQISKQLRASIQQAIKKIGFDFLPNGNIIPCENLQLTGLSKQLQTLQGQLNNSGLGSFSSSPPSSFQERKTENPSQSKCFCTGCGKQLQQSSKFCASCGSPNLANSPSPTTANVAKTFNTNNSPNATFTPPTSTTTTTANRPLTTSQDSGQSSVKNITPSKNITPIPINTAPTSKPNNSNKCPLCDFGCDNVEDLQIHFLSSHIEDDQSPPPQKFQNKKYERCK